MESQPTLRNIPAWSTLVVKLGNRVRTNDSTWSIDDWEKRAGRLSTRKDEVSDIVIGLTLGVIDPWPTAASLENKTKAARLKDKK